jgi:hypothetical protein
MWSCWQHAHPGEQPGDWQDQAFSFVDENGAEVTRTVKDFLDTKALGYVYDNDSNCTRTAIPQVAVALGGGPEQAPLVLASSAQPIPLNPTTTSVDIRIPAPRLHELTEGASKHQTLVLRDVSSQSDPGALLSVYVARKDAPNAREYVGTINWFGVFDPMEGMNHEGRVSRTFRYDITRQLQAMRLTDTGELTVTFEATSGLVASTKKGTGGQQLATPPVAAFRPDAQLRVAAIEVW